MFVRIVFTAAMTVVFTSPVSAQTADQAVAPTKPKPIEDKYVEYYRPLIESRCQWVGEMYALDEAEVAGLRDALKSQIPTHVAYMLDHDVTLRRYSIALGEVIPNETGEDDKIRAKVARRLRDKIYSIHARAPLSVANLIRRVEAKLSPPQVQKGRNVIQLKYAAKLQGRPFSLESIDRLLLDPFEPSVPKRIPQATIDPTPPLTPPSPGDDLKLGEVRRVRGNLRPDAKPAPVQRPPRPAVRRGPPVAPPPPPAPALNEWVKVVHDATLRYGYSDDQKARAVRIHQACHKRARLHREKNKQAYQTTEKLTDAKAKNEKLRELNRPLDKLYSELNQRLRSIASVEQQQAAEKKERKDSPRQ